MKYRVHWQGQDLGVFTLEELRQRRNSGALRGTEWVLAEGAAEWKALDFILEPPGAVPTGSASPITGRRAWRRPWVWAVAVLMLLLVAGLAVLGVLAFRVAKRVTATMNQAASGTGATSGSELPQLQTNAPSEIDFRKQQKAFRVRQYMDGFKQDGAKGQPWHNDAALMLEAWIEEKYGAGSRTNLPASRALCDKLIAAGCRDPLILTVAGVSQSDLEKGTRHLKDAVGGFEKSGYKAYPRMYATVSLAGKRVGRNRVKQLDASALVLLQQALQDGSVRPEDARELADIFDHGWAEEFFERNAQAVVDTVKGAGKPFEWLALTLEGMLRIKEAWKSRGGGYADTVTDRGWQGFGNQLARAGIALTNAWQLRTNWPLPASLMITVSMGNSYAAEMRLWFERATAAQFDHPKAWNNYLWGLRPRWLGSHEKMLRLGVAALDTGRFDTDVPRQFSEVVDGIEADTKLNVGEHLFARGDIWPELKRMYEGYIAATAGTARSAGWRSDFAAVAYLAGRYDVAQKQLEAIDWNPGSGSLKHWGRELSVMIWEVAARNSPAGREVAEAERARRDGDPGRALALYAKLAGNNQVDDRTRQFIKMQSALAGFEQRLQKGDWVDFLPPDEKDDNWMRSWGKTLQVTTNLMEVQSGPEGHLLYSRANVGPDFEVRGEFEVVSSPTKEFQAGLAMGMLDFDTRYRSSHWFAFRIWRSGDGGDNVSFSKGWTQNWVRKAVILKDDRNVFHFRFEDRKATASLNGAEVLRNVTLQRADFSSDGFLVGICAIHPSGESVVRYRNLQIRRLTNASVSEKP